MAISLLIGMGSSQLLCGSGVTLSLRDNYFVVPEPQSSCDEPIPINKLIAT